MAPKPLGDGNNSMNAAPRRVADTAAAVDRAKTHTGARGSSLADASGSTIACMGKRPPGASTKQRNVASRQPAAALPPIRTVRAMFEDMMLKVPEFGELVNKLGGDNPAPSRLAEHRHYPLIAGQTHPLTCKWVIPQPPYLLLVPLWSLYTSSSRVIRPRLLGRRECAAPLERFAPRRPYDDWPRYLTAECCRTDIKRLVCVNFNLR